MRARPTIVSYAAVSHVGLVRDANEDSVLVRSWAGQGVRLDLHAEFRAGRKPFVCAVLDGMGGYPGGALASRTVAHALARRLDDQNSAEPSASVQALQDAHHELVELSGYIDGHALMSTTAVLAAVGGGEVTVTNAGDCRAYRLWEGFFSQLTVDDRVPDPRSPGRSLVSQALGGIQSRPLEPHQVTFDVASGCTVLLCSDGLHDVVGGDQMRDVLAGSESVSYQAYALVKLALKAGAPDNISVVVMQLRPEVVVDACHPEHR